MPMPWGFRHAGTDFKRFLGDARCALDLESDNMAYTAVDGVFQTFRRRLTPAQGIAFADTLPELLRALFVYRWDVTAPPVGFADRATMTAEAQAVRRHHNLTPDHAIAATAWAVRRALREPDLDAVLARIGPQAQAFWHVEPEQAAAWAAARD